MKTLDLLDDIVVFDMDGVLNRYDFSTLDFKIKPEKEWIKLNMTIDVYKFAKKTELFDELIKIKDSKELYVLTGACTSYEQRNKIAFIKDNYPDIPEHNIIFVGSQRYKIEVLTYLRSLYDGAGLDYKRIVMIEDNPEVLSDIEKLSNKHIKCYLVSDFI